MSAFRKLQSRVTSFLLALTILLTSIPSVSAYTDASTSGTHGGGSATSKGTQFEGCFNMHASCLKRKGIGDLECEKTYPFVFDYAFLV